MKPRLKNISSNPFVQSAVVGALVTLLVYFIWDPPITKYNIEVNPMGQTNNDDVLWFVDDFNGDGNSERIRCFQEADGKSLDIVNYDHLGNLQEHHHYRGYNWSYRNFPKIFDTNSDGIKELLYFDERNDSIFLNAVNLKDFSLQINHHFFHKIERHHDNYAFYSLFHEFGDFDKDGTKELFFSFDAGYGLYPRGIFKIEFPSLAITGSPTEYMSLHSIELFDINSDGLPEILPASSAPSNSSYAKKYTDTCSYLLVLNLNLQPTFEPLKMQGNYSYTHCIPCFEADNLFFALCRSLSNMQKPAELMLLNSSGDILKSKEWNNIKHPENMNFGLSVLNNVPYLIISNIGRFELNSDLSGLPGTTELNYQHNKVISTPFAFDFNNDRVDELIFWNRHDDITILGDKTDESLTFRSPIPLRWGIQIYPCYENNELSQFAFTTLGGFFFLKYKENDFFFMLYLIYMIVFSCSSGLIFTILYFQKRTIEKKWATEKQLSELQFNQVKNQLNPHFLFNALNSVAFMINEGKNDEAYDFLAVNSRMIQRVMNDAKEVKRPLKDEIQFTKDYLSIQKHRFKNRFEARFIIDENLDQLMEVPKMCIHTYVENAIKHGFRDTKKGGILNIEIESYQKHGVLIWISDNGMGRKSASRSKDSSGNGINIMNDFYRLFEKYHGYKIDFTIGDNILMGTIVKLRIVLPHKN